MEDVNSDSIVCETQSTCQFCNLGDVNEEDLGPLYHRGAITVHKNCLVSVFVPRSKPSSILERNLMSWTWSWTPGVV